MYDSRADVYSWAVLAAEVLSQKLPYDGHYLTPMQACGVGTFPGTRLFLAPNRHSVSAWCWQVAIGVSKGVLRPTLPSGALPEPLTTLITRAWSPNPSDRPAFAE